MKTSLSLRWLSLCIQLERITPCVPFGHRISPGDAHGVTRPTCLIALLLLALTIPLAGRAVVFTNDTLIGPLDQTYDGQDIVVSNGVLTVDGWHTFNSLRVAAGATLTHSAVGSGPLSVIASITNEAHVLTETNPVTLVQGNVVLSSVVITDTNGLVTYANELDYVVTNAGVTLRLQRTTNSFIADGDTVLVSYDYQTTLAAGLYLTVTTDVEIESDASVNADGRGFSNGAGTGAGQSAGSPLSGGGAGHGGNGGLSSANAADGMAYGSLSGSNPGSSGGAGLGGPGGSGGGSIQWFVGGNCILNGSITADGQNATNNRAGGGSGGGISITAQSITGTGTLSVRGGNGEPVHGGGGGGGRIALVVEPMTFEGTTLLHGGAGWQRGGAGTLYVSSRTPPSKLTIDNGGFHGANTPIDLANSSHALEVRGCATVVASSGVLQTLRSLLVRSNSTITTITANPATLNWSVLGDAVIELGATVSVVGKGYPPNGGPGGGGFNSTVGAGAGHGGYGGSGLLSSAVAAGGNTHGSLTSPSHWGSGGRPVGNFPGGSGGGAVRLTVTGNLQLDGMIIADGTAGSGTSSGGGSGGSVWLTLGGFSGNGVVSANGGAGGLPYGGGGGGGRIAVAYSSNSFHGILAATGGHGAVGGGAGTIYTKPNSSSFGDVRVDNGGLKGTNTPLESLFPLGQLSVTGGAVARSTASSLSLQSLTVGETSTLLFGNSASPVNVTVSSNVTVAAGGRISGDGLGYSAALGPGYGAYSLAGSSGGGHGGYGGRGAGAASGGNAYDSTSNPLQSGSGGGDRTIPMGGAGGAPLHLTVNGTLVLDGQLSANGISPTTNNAGGGAGGSLWLALNRFSGAGQISADGGNGHLPNGGGGGGGRIAVYWNSNSFTGTYSAEGGLGFGNGGAGTIYLNPNNGRYPSLIVDNGGRLGTNTLTDSYLTTLGNLTLDGGASVSFSSLTVSNLTIGSNAALRVGSQATINVSGSANIAAGGSLRTDGTSPSGQGNGQSSSQGSGGGGHGGYGGRGFGGSSYGGNYYDSIANPSQPGSRGGTYSGSGVSSNYGGGSLRMTVSGPMILNGVISANGNSAPTNSGGGGSGGSLWLTLNQLSGSGLISADGGNGHLPNGGGGGGGRIAIFYNSNSFTGALSAKGGAGYGGGGAGTIYLKRNASPLPSLIVDNGGLVSTNTPLSGVSSLLDLNVLSGASFMLPYSSPSLTMSNLHIGSNAVLMAGSATLTVSGAANIAAGGSISADAASSSGSGSGRYDPQGSGGGGYGGYGGSGAGRSGYGGNVYGPSSSPSQSGSSGGWSGSSYNAGLGGGAIRMTVSGPLVLDGLISANGGTSTNSGAGGGSGGSVWLTLNQFSGNGSIFADGGSGNLPNGGGGGGGRIAIFYNTNSFTGTLSAKGGNGFQAGGAGTIYLKPTAGQFQTASLLVDNGGMTGTNTVFDVFTLSNLTIRGGARLRPASSSTISLSGLSIATNSTLLSPPNNTTLNLSLSGPAVVEEGGSISAEGAGFAAGQGASGGAGIYSGSSGGGGGHAGYGGRGLGATGPGVPSPIGGNAYDSLNAPTLAGSGGGGLNASGGAGGGVIRIDAGRAFPPAPFTLDGRITANGLNALSNGAGGGAGGTISLSLRELVGSGVISADGGNGHLPNGGGGGGGRVSVSYTFSGKGNGPYTNGFLGTFSAKGGNGFVPGGAGTVYVRTNIQGTAQAFVDNGSARGTNTLVFPNYVTSSYDLTIGGGAVATALGQPRDLFVRSNGWLATVPQLQQDSFFITRNATFDVGGGIELDGLGTSTIGNGSTFGTAKGGGGHGGYGALNFPGGGNAYDSAIAPTQSGSRGGNGSGSEGLSPRGGLGGGVARLTVGSTLLLNGEFSADGLAGEFNSGGGSGGSLWIEAVTLAGNGRITARGGMGNGTAGGGGGGRIAIYYTTNLFTGEISACGGDGAASSGAGTIYFRNTMSQLTSMLVDNCGLWGTNTPLSLIIGLATNLTVTAGAIAEMQGPIPAFSNLVVSAGGLVTARATDTNLYLILMDDLTITDDSGIATDAKGFARGAGPGAGGTWNGAGAGGSHGGWGGDSLSGAFSGADYGTATRPVDRGSGGGAGSGPPNDGSEGGGAIRLAVAGTLALDGFISADGNHGLQDNSGGGSGGSVWISAKNFTGHGAISADGGDGEFYAGGGGGGGRVAIYSPTNTFTGSVSAAGGDGAFGGEAGTIFTSGILSGFDVVSQTPSGLVTDAVSEVQLEFSEPINPLTVAAEDVRLYTPRGLLPASELTLTVPAPATLRLAFPPQNVPGDYRLEIGPLIEGLLAARMSQVYTGAFSSVMPLLQGWVKDTNGQAVAGVLVHASGGLIPAITEPEGTYTLGVPAGWSGTVTPAFGDFQFVPGRRVYTNVTADLTDEDFLMIASLSPALAVGGRDGQLHVNWHGYAGVTYQVYWSTNLLAADWYPLEPPIPGTNGVMEFTFPIGSEPERYFRLRARN